MDSLVRVKVSWIMIDLIDDTWLSVMYMYNAISRTCARRSGKGYRVSRPT